MLQLIDGGPCTARHQADQLSVAVDLEVLRGAPVSGCPTTTRLKRPVRSTRNLANSTKSLNDVARIMLPMRSVRQAGSGSLLRT